MRYRVRQMLQPGRRLWLPHRALRHRLVSRSQTSGSGVHLRYLVNLNSGSATVYLAQLSQVQSPPQAAYHRMVAAGARLVSFATARHLEIAVAHMVSVAARQLIALMAVSHLSERAHLVLQMSLWMGLAAEIKDSLVQDLLWEAAVARQATVEPQPVTAAKAGTWKDPWVFHYLLFSVSCDSD